MRIFSYALSTIFMIVPVLAIAGAKQEYSGIRSCTKCHVVHGESWAATEHANAFESLKPGVKAKAKIKAELDPSKNYTEDKDCLGCHTTGFGEATGYQIGMPPGGNKALGTVGCETCHGAGIKYRKKHRKAVKRMNLTYKSTPRKVLVETGQNFDYKRECSKCHLAYEGSPFKEAKPPYTPFTPNVDAKYLFDFDQSVKNFKSMHEHYKLEGIFEGEPVPPIRMEFQKTAKELPQRK